MTATRREDLDPARLPVDHRAEAVRLGALAEHHATDGTPVRGGVLARVAQVHATLATGTPVAGQHASEALVGARRAFDALSRKHVALHEAVRTLVQSATPAAAAGYWMAPEDLMKRLAELVR